MCSLLSWPFCYGPATSQRPEWATTACQTFLTTLSTSPYLLKRAMALNLHTFKVNEKESNYWLLFLSALLHPSSLHGLQQIIRKMFYITQPLYPDMSRGEHRPCRHSYVDKYYNQIKFTSSKIHYTNNYGVITDSPGRVLKCPERLL